MPRETNRTEYDFAFVVNVAGEASVVREKLVLFLMGSSIPIALCLAARFSATVKGGSDPMKLLGGFTAEKWGRSHPIYSFFSCDFSIRDVAHPFRFPTATCFMG